MSECTYPFKKSLKKEDHVISFSDVTSAQQVIRPYVYRTPMITCTTFDKLCCRNLYFKCENFQKTGCFKYRGILNAVYHISQRPNPPLVVTASSGNQGMALASSAKTFGLSACILVPTDAPQCKKDAIRGYGGTVVECENWFGNILNLASQICEKRNGCLVSSSVNPNVVAGYATIALEMLEQNPDLDIIVAPVGSGGMISGIAIAAKHLKPSIRIYAAEPELANDCYLSKINGKITPLSEAPKTIADGVKATICKNTWPIIRDLVDDVITVSEEEIKQATKLVWERAKLVIEPTSGVGVAAVMSKKFSTARNNNDDLKNVGVVLCGGNIDFKGVSSFFIENDS